MDVGHNRGSKDNLRDLSDLEKAIKIMDIKLQLRLLDLELLLDLQMLDLKYGVFLRKS